MLKIMGSQMKKLTYSQLLLFTVKDTIVEIIMSDSYSMVMQNIQREDLFSRMMIGTSQGAHSKSVA